MSVSLKKRLLGQFLLSGLIPIIVIGLFAFYFAKSVLIEQNEIKFQAVVQTKKIAIEEYFNTIKKQVKTLSNNKMIVDATKNFKTQFHSFIEENSDQNNINDMRNELKQYYLGPFAGEYKNQNGKEAPAGMFLEQLDDIAVAAQYYYIQKNANPLGSKHLLDYSDDQSSYSLTHKSVHPIVRQYLEEFGYYDIFIIDDETGHIIYSVFKELDYGTSLRNGPYADTNFAEAYRKARQKMKGEIVLVDYKQYSPSYEAPASFIASPIYDGSTKVGVLVFQMPIDRLNKIMTNIDGLGETGETYLVGQDKLLRSDSRLDPELRNVVSSFRNPDKSRVDVPEMALAFKGEIGHTESINYLEQDVLTAYLPVDLTDEIRWAAIANIHTSEGAAAAMTLGYYIIGIALVSLVYTIFNALYVGKSISNPILSFVSKIDGSSKQVSAAAGGLASSSQLLSELANQQASAIDETAASIEEISAMVKNNVEQAKSSAGLSEKVKDISNTGNQSMSELVSSMVEITESNSKIQELVKVIGEIGEKTEVIDEIVFQTKLLSFNASVEAERAGEHGRGFAVVAQEVGNLAQMSGKAALEIASMVKASIKNAEIITKDNKTKVEKGNTLVEHTAKYLQEIHDASVKLSSQSTQIVSSSKEQAEGINQINTAITDLDRTTQQNSTTADSTSRSSKNLNTQAGELFSNVASLIELITGDTKIEETSKVTSNPSHSEKTKVLELKQKSDDIPMPEFDQQPKIAVGQSHGSNDDDWDSI
jgi:methyl-accepting chemotaxis protein